MPTPSATGSGQRGTVFTPPNQPLAAQGFANVISPEVSQAVSGLEALGQTPASLAYPYATGDVIGGIQNNPYAGDALAGAAGAQSIAYNQTVPATQQGGGTLLGLGGLAAGQAPGTLAAGGGVYNTLTPQVPGTFAAGTNVYDTLSGLVPGAVGAGQGTFDYLRSLAPGPQAAGQSAYGTLSGLAPQAYTAGGNAYGTLAGQVPGILNAGNTIAQTAFDPQSALFNRTQQQLIDQSNAVNSMSGVAGTPYGASLTNNALGNFDINWQNNLLNRQQQGLAGLNAANAGAGSLLSTGTGALNAGDTTASNLILGGAGALNAGNAAAGNLALGGQGALNAGNAAAGNLLGTGTSALYGGNTSGGNLALGGLEGLTAANASLGGLTSAAGSGFGNAASLYGYGGNQFLQGGAAPYNTSVGIQGNNLSGLSNLINIGNQNYTLPQQVTGNLLNYLGYGQNASGLANQIGNTNFNQLAQGFGGVGSLLGSGLGFGSPSNPGWLTTGLSDLFAPAAMIGTGGLY